MFSGKLKRITPALVSLVGFSAALPGAAHGQKQIAPVAPPSHVPAEILTAQTIFISNTGGGCDPSNSRFSNNADRAYEELYDTMEKWGRYRVADSPGDAQLNFEIGLPCPPAPGLVLNGGSSGPSVDPQLRLVILDMTSRAVLWAITEHVEDSNSEKAFDKNWSESMQALISKLKGLARVAPAVPGSVSPDR
ncbi:MAG: hypothetical protein WA399_06655 [Acidobacteriaceae bacterium]